MRHLFLPRPREAERRVRSGLGPERYEKTTDEVEHEPQPEVDLQKRFGNRTVAQMMRGRPTRRGGRSRAQSLPSRLMSSVQRMSGMDLSDVRVFYGSNEPSRFGAGAFTRGSDIYVGHGYEKHLAHEAWHVVQQRQGRVRSHSMRAGMGVNTDRRLESEADRMGRRASTLGNFPNYETAGSSLGGSRSSVGQIGGGPGVVQCYSICSPEAWPGKGKGPKNSGKTFPFRVSNDSKLAVYQDSHFGSHQCYAVEGQITAANEIIKKQGGGLSMTADKTDAVSITNDKISETLYRVVPKNEVLSYGGSGDSMFWVSDCGGSAHSVMTGDESGKSQAKYNKAIIEKEYMFKIKDFRKGLDKQTDPKTYGTTYSYYSSKHKRRVDLGTPQEHLAAIFEDISNDSFQNAWKGYQKLSDKLRDKFDQIVGLNQYAQPEIGEAYVIVANQDEYASGTKAGWNYHWGAVVLKSGGDSVTFENFADPSKKTSNDWSFQMYGSEKGQTWHDDHKKRKMHHRGKLFDEYGPNPTTLRIVPKG